jgi:hypothetical protein
VLLLDLGYTQKKCGQLFVGEAVLKQWPDAKKVLHFIEVTFF